MPHRVHRCCGLLIGCLLVACCGSRSLAGSIFDMDEKDLSRPPPATRPAGPTLGSPPPATPPSTDTKTTPVTPKVGEPTPVTTPVTAAPVTAAPVLRPIPSLADRQTSQRLFNELFAREISNRNPAARRALARQFSAKAREPGVNDADEMVLLAGARQAAEDAKDLTLCFRAIDAMADRFDVDALRLKTKSALVVCATRAESNVLNESNCAAGLKIIDRLVAEANFIEAARLVRYLSVLPVGDPSISTEAKWQAKRVEQAWKVHDRLAKDFERLAAAPNDPGSSAAVGQFVCFYQDLWDVGLPVLGKGSDPRLRDLAASEIIVRDGKDAAASAEIADAWWQVAEQQPEIPRDIIRRHAATSYERALSVSTGLRRDVMAKRIALARAGTKPRWLVLLRSDDPSIWNHPTGQPADDNAYAADVASAPNDTAFLRLRRMDTGDAVIIAMKQDELLKQTPTWCGTAWTGYGGTHLGIKDPAKKILEKGLVDIDANYEGWGFGHVMYAPEGGARGYAWAGVAIEKVILEISVTREDLTPAERKLIVGEK